jgi:hypothetical protein
MAILLLESLLFDILGFNSYSDIASGSIFHWETSQTNETADGEVQEDAGLKKKIPNIEYTNLNATVATWNYFPNIPHVSVREPTVVLNASKCRKNVIDTSPPPKRTPTNNACDGYAGVLHIEHGDVGGASGTIFFQFIVGFLQWADQHNYLPWIHLSDFSKVVYDSVVHGQGPDTNFAMMDGMYVDWARDPIDPLGYLFPGRPEKRDDIDQLYPSEFSVQGTGVWTHYFEPVSDFVPGDPSCTNKPLVKFDVLQVVPGLHSQTPFSPHAWRYWMPDHMQRLDLWLQDWLVGQRINASYPVRRYIRFNAHIQQRAACAHPNPENSLGMHIRHGDKYPSRNVIQVRDFYYYAAAFVNHGGGSIYLATDSAMVLDEIILTWPEALVSRLVFQDVQSLSTKDGTAAFDSDGAKAHRSNTEALTDILALSKCTYLLHGLSAMTESAFYLNPGLMERAINLDDLEQEYDVAYFVNEILPRGKNATISNYTLPKAIW